MQVPQSSSTINSSDLQDLPARLGSQLVLGQRLEAVAVTAAAKAEQVKVQIGNTVIEFTADKAVQPGQKIQLEVVQQAGRLALQMVDAELPPRPLQQGMRFNAEIVALQSQQQLLVAIKDGGGQLPAKMQIDVSSLGRQFQPSQMLQLEVAKLQPLSVVLRPAVIDIAAQIRDLQRMLLPLVQDQRLLPSTLNMQHSNRTLPAPLSAPLTQLISHVVERQNLPHANVLRDALQNSGQFLEQRLQTGQATTQDFKGNLMRLAAAVEQQLSTNPDRPRTEKLLRQLPAEIRAALTSFISNSSLAQGMSRVPEANLNLQQIITQLQQASRDASAGTRPDAAAMTRAIEISLMRDLLQEVRSLTARVQLNQLAMVRDPELPSSNPVWLMELPVRDRQELSLVRMRIQQQQTNVEQSQDIWQVQLNLETTNSGPMQALLTLHQQQVSVTLVAERPETAKLLTQYLDELRTRLQTVELTVGQLNCRCAPVAPLSAIEPASEMHDAFETYVDIHV
ncbi:MAG: flagellar hook-length control protein FliK [Methylophaga sp.]|nr:flagellar hook-length control protein FliK [Methylophaga sp.]